jgi:Iron-sulfur cluster assembly protein
MKALEEVNNPDLNIDIVNLGLVYGVDIDDEGNVKITMTLTAMDCPNKPKIRLKKFPPINHLIRRRELYFQYPFFNMTPISCSNGGCEIFNRFAVLVNVDPLQ